MGLFNRKDKNHAHAEVDIERDSAELVGRLDQLAIELERLLAEAECEQEDPDEGR